MTTEEFNNIMDKIKAQEKTLDVIIDIYHIIDKDHLDCTWYGGEVGTIELNNGYIITIGAYGDIILSGVIDGQEVFVSDKNNGGYIYNELGLTLDDKKLYELLYSQDENNYLEFWNNNWFEVNLISPDGVFIDLFVLDNVLDNNILDCFLDIEKYFQYVKWVKGREC